MSQYRAIIETDSPLRVAEQLEAAGCTLLGPWAEKLRKIVGADVQVQVLKVVPS